MEIILKQEVENLGYKDQIVNVKPGYANNFLVPQGYAVVATASAKKVHEENLRQRAHKESKMVADATAVAAKLDALTITLTVKSNATGKIFGAITTSDIAQAIANKGIEVDKRNIKVGQIKQVGSHVASVRLYKEIAATLNMEVVSNESVEAAEDKTAE